MNELTYEEHYLQCVREANFQNEGGPKKLREITLSPITASQSDHYLSLLSSLRNKIDDVFSNHEDQYDLLTFCKEVKDPLKFTETTEIFNLFYETISETMLGCHFTTNSIQIYRNHFTESKKESSWLWHYDDNPDPQIKLFIYLSDVNNHSAPFTYIVDKNDNGRKIRSSRISPSSRTSQVYSASRIPQGIIDGMMIKTYKEKQITGPAGTAFIFDPNIIHRATVPEAGLYRDVLVYHLHPCKERSPLRHFYGEDVKKYEF